jgi:hypothetical protein
VERANRAYVAMQLTFGNADGSYRRDEGRVRLPGSRAHLWPFIRALVATLDLAGVAPAPPAGFDAEAAIALRMRELERYWNPPTPSVSSASSAPAAYASDPPGTWFGGDRYYDDNAWVGLALVQLERMRPGAGRLDRAQALWRFAARGWADDPAAAHPGGVFWVEQGRGAGRGNHDRNAVSTAPNAQLALHLQALGALTPADLSPVDPGRMCAWVTSALDAGGDGDGLFWDKIRGDGTVDRARWSYNQGAMIGLHVLLARRGAAEHLARAERIARRALIHYAGGGLERQPPAFNAIFLRNLLTLHAATADAALRAEILATLTGYAADLWERRRDGRDRIRHPDRRAPTLLDHSAAVSVFALLAWDPGDYATLA